MKDMEQQQEQPREQYDWKRCFHALLLKICPIVIDHTQRYVDKTFFNDLLQWIEVALP